MNEGPRPVFIHSLFRAGSTYVFQVFRRAGAGQYLCYQEPLHELIAQLPDHADRVEAETSAHIEELRHPELEHGYFHEFLPRVESIRRTFSTDFSYDEFFIDANDAAPALKAYISCLTQETKQQPVLQCCRSTGRIGWFRRNFDAVHLFLLRNPWDQWWSYRVKPYFETTICMILTAPSAPAPIKAAASAAGIVVAPPVSLPERMRHYEASPRTPEQSYLGFYALWLYSLLEATQAADLILAMDRLGLSEDYRKQTLAQLDALGITNLDFSDCMLPRRRFNEGDASFFRAIEQRVHELFLANGISAQALEDGLELSAALNPMPLIDAAEPPNVDSRQVLDRLGEWVSRQPTHDDATSMQPVIQYHLELPDFLSSSPSLVSLLRLPPAAFVYCAYIRLLKRAPDTKGFRHYRHKLAEGRSKLAILWELFRAPEARRHGMNRGEALRFAFGLPHRESQQAGLADVATQLASQVPDPAGDSGKLLLVLNHYPVSTTHSGGAAKIRGLFGNLPSHYSVALVTMGGVSEATVMRLASNITEINLPLTLSQGICESALYRGIRQWLLSRTADKHPLLLALIREFLRRNAIVILTHPYLAVAASACGATRVVYDSHNAEAGLASVLQYPWLAIRDIARCERQALGMSRFATSVSEEDRTALVDIAPFPLPIHYLPIGSNTVTRNFSTAELAPFKRELFGNRHIITFVGSDHPHDRQAGEYIISHLAPLLGGRALLVIVGNVCDGFSGLRSFGNVLLLGHVDIAVKEAIYAMTDVALNPVTNGSGANVKLSEYLASGLPVLTTPFGSRGFALEDGKHAQIRKRKDFPQALNQMLSDPALRQAMGREAAAYAKEHLDWARIAGRFADLLTQYFEKE